MASLRENELRLCFIVARARAPPRDVSSANWISFSALISREYFVKVYSLRDVCNYESYAFPKIFKNFSQQSRSVNQINVQTSLAKRSPKKFSANEKRACTAIKKQTGRRRGEHNIIPRNFRICISVVGSHVQFRARNLSTPARKRVS